METLASMLWFATIIITAVHAIAPVRCRLEEDNTFNFLEKCFCAPGWDQVFSKPGLPCAVPLAFHSNCQCRVESNHSSTNVSLDIRCDSLCRWNSDTGVTQAHLPAWETKQQQQQQQKQTTTTSKQLAVDKKRLLREFDNFAALGDKPLGHVAEFGSG
jgi:hypothetical protein